MLGNDQQRQPSSDVTSETSDALPATPGVSAEEMAALELVVDKQLRAQGRTDDLTDPNMFAPRRVVDGIFDTFTRTRDYVREQLDLRPKIEREIRVPTGDEGQSVHEAVMSATAIGLLSAAYVAYHWKKHKGDPLDAAHIKADELLKQLEQARDPSLETLFLENQIWGGLSSAFSASPQLIEELEKPLPVDVLASRGQFTVEPMPGASEDIQIATIAQRTIERLMELCSDERKGMLREMRDWPVWEKRIIDARASDAGLIQDMYQNAMLPTDLLLRLGNINESTRERARKDVEGGGFLHHLSPDDVAMMLTHGETMLLCANEQESATAFGYYSVITDNAAVKECMREMCGYESDAEYITEADLPSEAPNASKVQWQKSRTALDLLRSTDDLAFALDIVVGRNPISGHKRNAGEATALKYKMYRRLKDKGLSQIIIRRYEILEVNGGHIYPPAENKASRRFGDALGDIEIGSVEESFEREVSEGRKISLKVLWHLFVANIEDTLKRIEEKRN